MRRLVGWLTLVVLVLAWSGCERPEDVRIDYARASAGLLVSLEAAAQQAELAKAADVALTALSAQPAVASAGEHLAAQLESDPTLTASLSRITEGIAKSPRMAHLQAALLEEAHGRDIGDVFGEKVEASWNQKQVMATTEAAAAGLFQQALGASPEVHALSAKLAPLLEPLLTDKQRLEAWGRRMTELNAHRVPDTATATEIYVQAAWAPMRIVTLVKRLTKNATVQQELGAMLAEVLALDSVAQELRRAVLELADDPQLRDDAITLMLDLLEPKLDVPEVQKLQRGLWLNPHVVKRVQEIVSAVINDPAAAQIARTHGARIAADPEVKKILIDFVDAW